jgi:hypothetical protein
MVDTAVLVISLALGFALVLIFIYRLGIEERFDKASVACLVGGLVLLGMATLGYGHAASISKTDQASLQDVQSQLTALSQTAVHVNGQVDTAMVTASKALSAAETARDRASLAPRLQQLQVDVAYLKADLAHSAPPTSSNRSLTRRRAWSTKMEARIAALEQEIRSLKSSA